MADNTKIEWTDATWNPVTGCSVVSPGCTNCYAMGLAGTRLQHHPSRSGLTRPSKAGPVWNGQVRLNEEWLTQPLQWKRPRMIFVCAHGDLFHESVPDAWIDRVFAVMKMAPHHTFQVLTKRSARMRAYFEARRNGDPWAEAADEIADRIGLEDHPAVLEPRDLPLRNVWLGVSAEDQRRADERVPDLLATPAAVRFVSAEPLLGPIDFTRIEARSTGTLIGGDFAHPKRIDALTGWAGHYPSPTVFHPRSHRLARLDWIIVGGESGPNARPMHPAWARSIRDQCTAAGVAFHFKQWGAWIDYKLLGGFGWSATTPQGKGYEGPVTGKIFASGGGYYDGGKSFPTRFYYGNETATLVRVGKRAAGRLLDGVEHNGMPRSAA